MKAFDFSLPDQNGQIHRLSKYKGSWVVLYFYPKDNTPGCIKEACSFRDGIEELKKINVIVLGVSGDGISSHKKFADKYNLNFPLLADEKKDVIKKYQAWAGKKILGREVGIILRKTYLINPKGEVVKKYEKVKPEIHAQQIIDDIKKLQQENINK